MIFVRLPDRRCSWVSPSPASFMTVESARCPQNVTPIYVTLIWMATAVSAPAGTAGPIDPERGRAACRRRRSSSIHPLLQTAALQPAPDRVRLRRPARARRRLRAAHAANRSGLVVTSHPDHVRSLFTAKPEQAPSLAGRVAAAADRRPELGPHRARRAPHAPAQAAAAALPRRGDRALHADDRRRRRARDRHAGRWAGPSRWRRACRRSRST